MGIATRPAFIRANSYEKQNHAKGSEQSWHNNETLWAKDVPFIVHRRQDLCTNKRAMTEYQQNRATAPLLRTVWRNVFPLAIESSNHRPSKYAFYLICRDGTQIFTASQTVPKSCKRSLLMSCRAGFWTRAVHALPADISALE